MKKEGICEAVLARIAKRQASGDDSGINDSDIPAMTDAQLAQFRRAPKVLVAAHLDRKRDDTRTSPCNPS